MVLGPLVMHGFCVRPSTRYHTMPHTQTPAAGLLPPPRGVDGCQSGVGVHHIYLCICNIYTSKCPTQVSSGPAPVPAPDCSPQKENTPRGDSLPPPSPPQAQAVVAFLDAVREKTLSTTVSLTASRGRGKSAAVGLCLAGAVAFGYSNIFVTAPAPENLETVFDFVKRGLNALKYAEHLDYEIVQVRGGKGGLKLVLGFEPDWGDQLGGVGVELTNAVYIPAAGGGLWLLSRGHVTSGPHIRFFPRPSLSFPVRDLTSHPNLLVVSRRRWGSAARW
jgi:hypothetical protein